MELFSYHEKWAGKSFMGCETVKLWSDLGIYDYVMAGILFGYQRICSSSVQSDYITGSALVPWTWARPRLERSLRDHLVMERVILYGQFSVMINDNHNKKTHPPSLMQLSVLKGAMATSVSHILPFNRLCVLYCLLVASHSESAAYTRHDVCWGLFARLQMWSIRRCYLHIEPFSLCFFSL